MCRSIMGMILGCFIIMEGVEAASPDIVTQLKQEPFTIFDRGIYLLRERSGSIASTFGDDYENIRLAPSAGYDYEEGQINLNLKGYIRPPMESQLALKQLCEDMWQRFVQYHIFELPDMGERKDQAARRLGLLFSHEGKQRSDGRLPVGAQLASITYANIDLYFDITDVPVASCSGKIIDEVPSIELR